MRVKKIALAVLFASALAFLSAYSIAGEDEETPLTAEDLELLDRYIYRLGLEDAKIRENAYKDLESKCLRLGPQVVPVLKDYLETASPEVAALLLKVLEIYCVMGDYREYLKLFDALGLPPISGNKFVRFNTGYGGISGTEYYYVYAVGWLLSETEDEATIVENTLRITTYDRNYRMEDWPEFEENAPDTEPRPGKYEELDFAVFCWEYLEKGIQDYYGDFTQLDNSGFEHSIEAALYAWWASMRGMDDIAFRLVELAKCSLAGDYKNRPEERPSFVDYINTELAINLRWQAITEAYRGKPRKELIEKWQIVAFDLPGNDLEDEAKEIIAYYENLIAEDEKWVEPAGKKLGAMTDAEKVDYWIYKLRDARAQQWGQPGFCFVLDEDFYPEGEIDPANKLLELGWAAIPALIEHLDDFRPTRCMETFYHFISSSYYLLRYGDCCWQILRVMTDLDLYWESHYSYMAFDGDATADCKAKAWEWWEQNREKGEFAFMTERFLDPEANARQFIAGLFLKKFGDRAVPVLQEMVAHTADDELHAEVVELIAEYDYERFKDWIRSQLEIYCSESTHFTTAKLIREKEKDPSGFGVVLADLAESGWPDEPIWEFLYEWNERLEYLLGTGVEEVEKELCRLAAEHHSAKYRTGIWQAFIDRESAVPDEVLAAIALSLGDKTENIGSTASMGGDTIRNPRACDYAAYYLAAAIRKPEMFPFEGSRLTRDRRVFALKNWWRERNGEELLEEKPLLEVVPVDKESAERAIAAFLNAETVRGAEDSRKRILSMGGGMLEHLVEAHANAGDSDTKKLELLIRDLCNFVRRIVYVNTKDSLMVALAPHVAGLSDRSVTGELFRAAVQGCWTGDAGPLYRLYIRFQRCPDGAGVVVFLSAGWGEPSTDGGLRSSWYLTLGSEHLSGGFGSGAPDYVLKLEDEVEELDDALARDPHVELEAGLTLGDR